jgi:hypothetical protein
MTAPTVATPHVLTDPGFLWIAPLGTTEPTNTVTAGVFSDTISSPWLPLGATQEGSTFSYSTTVEPIRVAELFDPVKYATTERGGNIAFNLADFTLSNYQRALNGGIAALTPTGAAGSELTTLEPPDPGNEVRSMLLWESTDQTLRLLLRQTLQGGEIASSFKKAPEFAVIPCTFNLEVPTGGSKPWAMWAAGTTRV